MLLKFLLIALFAWVLTRTAIRYTCYLIFGGSSIWNFLRYNAFSEPLKYFSLKQTADEFSAIRTAHKLNKLGNIDNTLPTVQQLDGIIHSIIAEYEQRVKLAKPSLNYQPYMLAYLFIDPKIEKKLSSYMIDTMSLADAVDLSELYLEVRNSVLADFNTGPLKLINSLVDRPLIAHLVNHFYNESLDRRTTGKLVYLIDPNPNGISVVTDK